MFVLTRGYIQQWQMFFINFDFQHFNTVSHPKNHQCPKQNISNPTYTKHTHTPRVSFSRFSPSRGAHTPDAFSDPRNGQFPGQTSLVRAIGQMHGSACPLTGESCKRDEDRITRSGARQTERDTVSWPRGRGLVVPRRIEEVATRTRRNTQHWRMRCLFAGGTFSSDSQWPAACRTCRRACVSLRSRAAVTDWPSIDRSYTRFGSRAFREGGW